MTCDEIMLVLTRCHAHVWGKRIEGRDSTPRLKFVGERHLIKSDNENDVCFLDNPVLSDVKVKTKSHLEWAHGKLSRTCSIVVSGDSQFQLGSLVETKDNTRLSIRVTARSVCRLVGQFRELRLVALAASRIIIEPGSSIDYLDMVAGAGSVIYICKGATFKRKALVKKNNGKAIKNATLME